MKPGRTGPRPLPLHLSTAATVSASSLSAWPLLKSGWTPWSENLAPAGKALRNQLEAVNPEAFETALRSETARRFGEFLTGLETYRAHDYRRTLNVPPVLWESGPVQLLDYGATHPNGDTGEPLLVVPSLVNRGYILDLTAERSFLRYLAAEGFRPLLVDWGTPDESRLSRTLDDIIAGDLVEILETACETAGGSPVSAIGYCMGGTLAVALAALAPERLSSLVLLAAPWDFHAGTDGAPAFATAGRPALEAIIAATGSLPVDVLQALFFTVDPTQSWKKFRMLGKSPPSGKAAAHFVALEDWLNDGVPLGAAVARTCLFDWYGENLPARDAWSVQGRNIVPSDIPIPTLAVIPQLDRIVPPTSALSLAHRLPHAEMLSPKAGHIGMMVGGNSKSALWRPVSEWLSNQL